MTITVPPLAATATPALARLWAALAGSELTDPASRALAFRIRARFPDAAAQVTAARRFHALAALRAVRDGARGVIFLAAGLPVEPQLHEEAAQAYPCTRFLYCDPHPEVTLLRQARAGDRCAASRASARDPEAVLADAEAAGLRPPWHVQLVFVPTFWEDRVARDVISRWTGRLPGGSSVALSVTAGGSGARPTDLLRHVVQACPHSLADVRGWLEDAGLQVQLPGVVPVTRWPFAPAWQGTRGSSWKICGVSAVKPVRRAGSSRRST